MQTIGVKHEVEQLNQLRRAALVAALRRRSGAGCTPIETPPA